MWTLLKQKETQKKDPQDSLNQPGHNSPLLVAEKADRPRRETRRPARYDDFECYTLQPQRMHADTNSENYLPPIIRKTCIEQQKEARNNNCLVAKASSRKNANSKELFYCAQEGALVHEITQETLPFCSCALTSEEVNYDRENCNYKSALVSTD